mmetsp:Transcript_755/g.1712  ORF Transcript_755/g.1712 Transcript_755/m.1712 type:complete len:250 (-) Transcript_755:144-893(-)
MAPHLPIPPNWKAPGAPAEAATGTPATPTAKQESPHDEGPSVEETALAEYRAELEGWWENLFRAAGSRDPETVCRHIDRTVEEDGAGLGDDVQAAVDGLCLRANVAPDAPSALRFWTEAMRRLPAERFFAYGPEASYILIGAGDTLHRWTSAAGEEPRRAEQLGAALHTMRLSMFVPGAVGTPFAHLLLGRIRHETGDREGAVADLARAFYIEDEPDGGALFEGLDEELLEMARQGAEELERGAETAGY